MIVASGQVLENLSNLKKDWFHWLTWEWHTCILCRFCSPERPEWHGCAVSDYLEWIEIQHSEQFDNLLYWRKGIRTCIDFVLNHTAKGTWVGTEIQEKRAGMRYEDMWLCSIIMASSEYEKMLTESSASGALRTLLIMRYRKICRDMVLWISVDLNYKTPMPFNQIAHVLFDTNKGLIFSGWMPYNCMWEGAGTSSMNLPQVHTAENAEMIRGGMPLCYLLRWGYCGTSWDREVFLAPLRRRECYIMA